MDTPLTGTKLTSHGLKVEQYLSNDNSGIKDHQQTEHNLNWTTLERLNRSPAASAHHIDLLQQQQQQQKHAQKIQQGCAEPDENVGYRFLKTEPNQTDRKIQKPKSRFLQFGFQKPTSAVFTLSHSQFILQHDRINSRSIFLHAVSLHF